MIHVGLDVRLRVVLFPPVQIELTNYGLVVD